MESMGMLERVRAPMEEERESTWGPSVRNEAEEEEGTVGGVKRER